MRIREALRLGMEKALPHSGKVRLGGRGTTGNKRDKLERGTVEREDRLANCPAKRARGVMEEDQKNPIRWTCGCLCKVSL